MTVKVSPKFQVVIPQEIRESLGIKAGSQVAVIAKGGIAYLVPVLPLKELQKKLTGKLDHKSLREKRDRL